ncbi:pyridoxamine 5'-phosphate oxidase family protein [Erythrobacter sp. HL-111]|uniref:pyridoxamine 5'-phosphate oxidase family protein n=1 Tax=Erythrobacter sp. HL-111 TaxID=1798193 RepID=UPI0006DA40FF|nr:pyridoxamine 5'-phosphate oxidase family protein [Erythrobacter sp. HL-111]KPP96339.1 MAG: Pyridoxamine-phosphate oxidase [Erythrobacteraceae bacterium HL-111]SDR72883.1 Pyridoxine/pyridoxamine 5'-phosphate oxidase [Erythrobacter sp. HL-111]
MFDALDDVLEDCTNRLVRGARDRKSPMHTPAVVTADVDARVMVLRAFDAAGWSLRFHTDTRAPKTAAIAADPRVAVLFYDKGAKIQIRARGTARVLPDAPITEEAWAQGTNFARRCYLGAGPGTPSDAPTSGLPGALEGVEPTDGQLVEARPNFAVMMVDLVSLDWLHLAHTGHVRAGFERAQDGAWQGRWLSP